MSDEPRDPDVEWTENTEQPEWAEAAARGREKPGGETSDLEAADDAEGQ